MQFKKTYENWEIQGLNLQATSYPSLNSDIANNYSIKYDLPNVKMVNVPSGPQTLNQIYFP